MAMDGRNRRSRALARWNHVMYWPLMALSVAFIVAYSMAVLAQPTASGERVVLVGVHVLAWAVFIVDFIVRITLTARGSRLAYVRQHPLDVVCVLLPLVRPFKLLGLLNNAPGFRGNGGNALRSRVVVSGAAYAVMFLYIIALTVLAVERPAPHATILSFGDSIWWACVTLATVGYGDYAPVTVIGRLLAVVLMAGGVVIIGTASALIVSYLSERITHRRRDEHHEQG